MSCLVLAKIPVNMLLYKATKLSAVAHVVSSGSSSLSDYEIKLAKDK